MEITKVLKENYLPYAKESILARAIPAIDGLKPVQRRILYDMMKLGATKPDAGYIKSARFVGDTMGKYHPHGDDPIYESLVSMVDTREMMNIPFVAGHGSFSKVYMRESAAAMRYTEAKAAPIVSEMLEGIDKNAVDFVPNYDDSETEPWLLPTKLCNILCNSSEGIAVGKSSSIPGFNLNCVCNTVIGLLDGTIKDEQKFMETIGWPEYSTGALLHADEKQLRRLITTGQGTFMCSGKATLYSDHISIEALPYKVTADDLTDCIHDLCAQGEFKEINDISALTDKNGFSYKISVKRNTDTTNLLKRLYRLTPLRKKFSYNVRVIIDNECVDMSIMQVLDEWIKFRRNTIIRIAQHELSIDKANDELWAAWSKINNRISDIIANIPGKTEAEAVQYLMDDFGMTEEQARYIGGMKLFAITKDNVEKFEKKRKELEDKIAANELLVSSTDDQNARIIEEQQAIIKKYGKERVCKLTQMIDEKAEFKETIREVSSDNVLIVVNMDGKVKRITSQNDIYNYELPEGMEEYGRWIAPNDGQLLLFTFGGEVRKININDIDASRGVFKEDITRFTDIDIKDICYIDAARDYTGYFNIFYHNGKAKRLYYSKIAGKRNKYISLYEPFVNGGATICKTNEGFVVTALGKASYFDISLLDMVSGRTAVRITRVTGSKDYVKRVIDIKAVPDLAGVDLDKYCKGYTVRIGEDVLE